MKHVQFTDQAITLFTDEELIARLFPAIDRPCLKATREVRGRIKRKARREAIAIKRYWLDSSGASLFHD